MTNKQYSSFPLLFPSCHSMKSFDLELLLQWTHAHSNGILDMWHKLAIVCMHIAEHSRQLCRTRVISRKGMQVVPEDISVICSYVQEKSLFSWQTCTIVEYRHALLSLKNNYLYASVRAQKKCPMRGWSYHHIVLSEVVMISITHLKVQTSSKRRTYSPRVELCNNCSTASIVLSQKLPSTSEF